VIDLYALRSLHDKPMEQDSFTFDRTGDVRVSPGLHVVDTPLMRSEQITIIGIDQKLAVWTYDAQERTAFVSVLGNQHCGVNPCKCNLECVRSDNLRIDLDHAHKGAAVAIRPLAQGTRCAPPRVSVRIGRFTF
jgi:hypothetical protein